MFEIVYLTVVYIKVTKNELQDIILRNEQTGPGNQLKTAQSFLRSYAEASSPAEKQQRFKDKEAAAFLTFAGQDAFYQGSPISIIDFIGEGGEQKVYHFDDTHVIKTNAGILAGTLAGVLQ